MRLPDDQGHSRLRNLKLFEARTGTTHPDLIGPDVEPALLYLAEWWRELDDARNADAPIGFRDIEAWMNTTGRHASGEEVLILRQIDRAYMHMRAEEARKAQGKKRDRHRPTRR
jgi:hypothetical protein